MKRWLIRTFAAAAALLCTACTKAEQQPNIIATTMPVYTFTQALCTDTPLTVSQLIQDNVSCLHDYTLTVDHMKRLENADIIVISGGGLEHFLEDVITDDKAMIDASAQLKLHHTEEHHHAEDHHHDVDPHFWLSIENSKQMAHSICEGLEKAYPEYTAVFEQNLAELDKRFEQLQRHADTQLSAINCREIITFHDGFFYMADAFNLTILHSVEEESGSEASAKDLIAICELVQEHSLPAIFAEKNGSDSAAKIICTETGAKLYRLDMAMSGENYFDCMYYNIDTLKEALG